MVISFSVINYVVEYPPRVNVGDIFCASGGVFPIHPEKIFNFFHFF